MGSATFTTSSGGDAATAIRQSLAALKVITVGDLLYVGEFYRSKIREDTFNGIDANGVPFEPYSTRGPYYLYPNGAVGRSAAVKAARATSSKNRFAATGRIGIRTPTGIKYESYAAGKAAHGVGNVNLYGMQQHPHMLDAMVVRAGGSEVSQAASGFFSGGGEMDAFQANQPCNELTIGFYDDTAERAKGNNEGTSTSPKREFFALSQARIGEGERAIGQRMLIRARAGGGSAGGGSAPATPSTITDDRSTWVGF